MVEFDVIHFFENPDWILIQEMYYGIFGTLEPLTELLKLAFDQRELTDEEASLLIKYLSAMNPEICRLLAELVKTLPNNSANYDFILSFAEAYYESAIPGQAAFYCLEQGDWTTFFVTEKLGEKAIMFTKKPLWVPF